MRPSSTRDPPFLIHLSHCYTYVLIIMKNHEKLHEFQPQGPSLDAKRRWTWNISSHSLIITWDSGSQQRISFLFRYFTCKGLFKWVHSPAPWLLLPVENKKKIALGAFCWEVDTRPSRNLRQTRFFLFRHSGIEYFCLPSHSTLSSPSWWIFDSIPKGGEDGREKIEILLKQK